MADLSDAELDLALSGECHTAEVVVWLAREVKRYRDARRGDSLQNSAAASPHSSLIIPCLSG